jgi:hypothetical protein
MKILFHDNTLSYRGTSVALYDYAWYNQEYLGNESIICYDMSRGYHEDGGTEDEVLEKFKKSFKVVGYENLSQINQICDSENVDASYFIKSGSYDGKISNRKNLIHCVFQDYQPHGDRYAYVSEWLSNKVTNGNSPFVPHMINLPESNGDFKEKYGLKNKIVVGRYGGYYTFDITWVKTALMKFVYYNPEYVFLFANTHKFTNHPNFIFTDQIVDLQEKSNFINTCDAMIHARQMGESFGISICEFMSQNKPVFAWSSGNDQHHVDLLQSTGTLYSNEEDLLEKLLYLKNGYSFSNYRDIVDKFKPESVMKKFKEVFLDE